MTDLQQQLRSLLTDRHTPETRAFFEKILTYADRRGHRVRRTCYGDLLTVDEVDEAVAEVLRRLITGALARFRGETMNELFAFVRTITDRVVWRAAQKKLRERDVLKGRGGEEALDWHKSSSAFVETVEVVSDVQLSETDREFLTALVEAESKVAYARTHNVSRAAVTQRVQRIRKRIAQLEPKQQRAVDAWLHMEARRHLAT